MTRRRSKRTSRTRSFFRFIRFLGVLIVLVLILDAAYIYTLAPDWNDLAVGLVPSSKLIEQHREFKISQGHTSPLRWQPVPLEEISMCMQRAVIVAEDSQFYYHAGIDLQALKNAMSINLQEGRIVYGASTITQQTVKNMFLDLSRTPLRKWHELWLTLWMERKLSKQRILEIYLNVAQFGPGVFGVEAAAEYYWDITASQLNPLQCAELAASLPGPGRDNPATQTARFQQRVEKISGWM